MLRKSAIIFERKYITNEKIKEEKINMEYTFLKNNNKLFHLFCAANKAEKRIDVVSIPSFAKRVKIRKTTTANIYSPNPSAPKYFAISRVRKNPSNCPPIRKKKDTPPFLNSSEKSLSSNAACSLLFIKLIDQKPRVQ